jgi:hypothetical protein
MLVSIPLKYAVPREPLARLYAGGRMVVGKTFSACGCSLLPVGRNETVIRECVKHREEKDMPLDQGHCGTHPADT